MQIAVKTLDAEDAGTIDLIDSVFGLEPRADILQRVVLWQLAKRRAGTHKVKSRGEVAGSTAKIYKQKGTGRARHGNKRAPIFRTGGRAHGPTPRDHAIDLPKKVRALGLRMALSDKAKNGKLVVVDKLELDQPRTKELIARLGKLGLDKVLFVGPAELQLNFALASRNLTHVDVLPSVGANVYDILRSDQLVISKAAAQELQERLA
ncbi:50S ribosomal protein L4 [Geminicoccus roseus]|uniref:50S ribosomal protein L4 n=1 Tax=Geminicoccus roseus TaxID=404900 RepID=UPI000414F5E8|nr:50S ribosomal protein L4 [Geminicoccus roseus]